MIFIQAVKTLDVVAVKSKYMILVDTLIERTKMWLFDMHEKRSVVAIYFFIIQIAIINKIISFISQDSNLKQP